MRVLVLGGDGFCGWPASLHLSSAGHEVAIVDNFARRGADDELRAASLTPIRSLNDRVAAWREAGGAPIAIHPIDVAQEYDELRDLLGAWRPDGVVHLARQRAATYSMRTATHKRYTVDNNVSATHNLLAALSETGAGSHVVAVGTTDLPGPRSVQGLTKALDRELLAFAAETDGLRITDLRHGVVWGTQTPQTLRDDALLNRFDHDDDYGTVLNRLLAQAALGDPLRVPAGAPPQPLTHLEDVVRCVALALERPPAPGEPVRVLEQVTEVHHPIELAARVAALTGATAGSPDTITGDLPVAADWLAGQGLDAVRVDDEHLLAVVELARRHRDRAAATA